MLCQFSFQNFKSYKDETTFDFRAMAIPEFQDALIRQEKAEDLLPVSAVYGPNGGGKTNLLQAFFCLINLVVKPIHALEKNRQPMIFQQGSSVTPFMLDESSANEPTIFQVFFRVGEKEYQYYISLKEEIVFESLLWRTLGGKKTGLIFERDGQKIELGASISKASINLDVNPKMPYLSFLAINYNIPVIAEVQNWFESCITQSYANPRAENIVLVSKSETTKESLIHALNDVGIDLSGYRYDEDTMSDTTTNGGQASANFGVSFARTSNVTAQIGKNESIVQSYTNYAVQHTLEVLEGQVKRMEESSALGMWEFAAYVMSKSPVIANNVAQMYLALTQGEQSYVTSAAVNLWDGEEKTEQAQVILKSVQKLQHPVFGLKDTLEDEWLLYPTLVTPAAVLSGKELAKSLNFPRKSVSGLPVLQSAAFGREVQKSIFAGQDDSAEKTIDIGKIYHMHCTEESHVQLDVDSLASHTFVTGSTGAGKSNVIYQLLSKLDQNGVKYLVIEPAKGEYKQVFGGNCNVYGTNSLRSELLRLNPFSFPEGIHVQEHIDRMVEIFNACWPMYAAMPAVLKDAVRKSYEKVGWNLNTSKCEPRIFPTMTDLLETLPQIVSASLYSDRTKSDYAGALVTRVKDLAEGINGQILCAISEVPNEKLFGENTIVDLSRIGSSETKALLMGMLVMKLQEYRMDLEKMNAHLVHVTVLEEAHNLLRKTATDQSQESANLQGKSVEMLTNSIAEMRTYGEGFIIADQAPDLLDRAVIKNTNTKIVLRLPDGSDRELVGSSMKLNEMQAMELARLPRGVAAVYQNDWVEAVLCHFEKYSDFRPLEYHPKVEDSLQEHLLKLAFGVEDNYELTEEDVDKLNEWIRQQKIDDSTKRYLRMALKKKTLNSLARQIIAYNLFGGKKIGQLMEQEMDDAASVQKKVAEKIRVAGELQDAVLIEECRKSVMGAVRRVSQNVELQRRYQEVEKMGRVL